MSDRAFSSIQIARRAKSNLALALACLPEQRKRDMISFYAFCRVVDDIADDPGTSDEAKERELQHWQRCVLEGIGATGNPVLDEAVALPEKYGFPRTLLGEIIEGVSSDLSKQRYQTISQLLAYCYKVASVVGLVSIEIFGYRHPGSRDYAIHLGYALQLTNIMRDVGEDARDTGRIYLPLEDLERFGVTETEILSGQHSERFVRLMDFQFERARDYYRQAQAHLHDEDRPNMIASEMMARIYSEILEKLKRQRYPVFARRCRLHPVRKAIILGAYLVRARLAFWRMRWFGKRKAEVALPPPR